MRVCGIGNDTDRGSRPPDADPAHPLLISLWTQLTYTNSIYLCRTLLPSFLILFSTTHSHGARTSFVATSSTPRRSSVLPPSRCSRPSPCCLACSWGQTPRTARHFATALRCSSTLPLWGYKPLYPHGPIWAAPSEVARPTR